MGCMTCGKIFSLARWMQLTWLGRRIVKGAPRFFRRCTCGGELSASVESLVHAESVAR